MFECDDEFNDGISSKYLDAAEKIVGGSVCLQNEMSIGDAYLAVTSAYEPEIADVDASIEGKKLASKLFSGKEIDIPMVVAPSKFGNYQAYELVLMSEELANSSRIEPLDPMRFDDQPKDECSLTRLRFASQGRDDDDDDDEMHYSNRPSW